MHVNANIDFDTFWWNQSPSKQATTRCYLLNPQIPYENMMFICGCQLRLVWNTLFHMQSSVSTGMEPFSFIRRRQFRRVHADTSQAITAIWQNRQQLLHYFLKSTNLWLWTLHFWSGVSSTQTGLMRCTNKMQWCQCQYWFWHILMISIPSKQATHDAIQQQIPYENWCSYAAVCFDWYGTHCFICVAVSTGMEPFSFIRRRQFRRVHADTSQAITNLTTSTTTFTLFLKIHKPLIMNTSFLVWRVIYANGLDEVHYKMQWCQCQYWFWHILMISIPSKQATHDAIQQQIPYENWCSYAAVCFDWYGTHCFICSRQFRPVWNHSVSYVVVSFGVCMQIHRKQ